MEFNGEVRICSLCGEPISGGEGYTSFRFDFVEADDPLWPFRDSTMHHQCFRTWELRPRYIEKFNEQFGAAAYGGVYYCMNEDGQIETRDSGSQL